MPKRNQSKQDLTHSYKSQQQAESPPAERHKTSKVSEIAVPQTGSTQAPPKGTDLATKRGQRATRRKVKFAEPVSQHRLYERQSSPAAPTTPYRPPSPESHASRQQAASRESVVRNALNELEPPYSLIAHLDLAASKLHARDSQTGESHKQPLAATKSAEETKSEPMKSLRAVKSSKSLNEPTESKAKKEKH